MVVQPSHITYLPTIRQLTDATHFNGNGRDLNHDHFYQWTNVAKTNFTETMEMKRISSNLVDILELAEDAKLEENPKGKLGFLSRRNRAPSLTMPRLTISEDEPPGGRRTSLLYNPDRGFEVNDLPKSYKGIFKAAGIKKTDLKDREHASKIFEAIRSVSPSVVGEGEV